MVERTEQTSSASAYPSPLGKGADEEIRPVDLPAKPVAADANQPAQWLTSTFERQRHAHNEPTFDGIEGSILLGRTIAPMLGLCPLELERGP
ncbi:MAG: hypothetical protein ACRDWD_08030 [Acidimicrobiia bacterium]